MSLLAVLALGFFLGMRHATDADHVVAVTTIVSREHTPRGAMSVGALWGLGHTVTIFLVGGAVVLFGLVIPARLGLSLELCVALMLLILGGLNVTGAIQRIDEAVDTHSNAASAAEPRGREGSKRWRARPLIVGVVHGLAGSAAIALLVLATIHHVGRALLYLLVFGAGTVLGMALLTSAMALPLAAASRRFVRFERRLARATGLASIAFGLFLIYRIGFVDGLFFANPTWIPR